MIIRANPATCRTAAYGELRRGRGNTGAVARGRRARGRWSPGAPLGRWDGRRLWAASSRTAGAAAGSGWSPPFGEPWLHHRCGPFRGGSAPALPSGGGTSQIPLIAGLAKQLGYRVVALVDGDPAKYAVATLTQIGAACDAVVRLPTSMAVERAILAGATAAHIRAAASVFPTFGQPDPTLGQGDDDVADADMNLLHKKGLHEQFFTALVPTLTLPHPSSSSFQLPGTCCRTGPSRRSRTNSSHVRGNSC